MKEQQGCSIHAVDSMDSAGRSFGVAGLIEASNQFATYSLVTPERAASTTRVLHK
jgi:hypothetical protein